MVVTQEAILFALFIFGLRVFNSAIGTMRLVVMARGQRWLTSVLGFIEALIFAFVTANVVTDLSNMLNLVAYCGGFSIGIYVGMAIETRFITSFVKVNIITPTNGHEIAVKLREVGHGVTEMHGEGGAGKVIMLNSVVQRKDTAEVMATVYAVNPQAFITMEEARAVQHGWLRALRHTR